MEMGKSNLVIIVLRPLSNYFISCLDSMGFFQNCFVCHCNGING